MENNKVSGIMLPIEANIISVTRKENESCQYKLISDLCVISWTRVKNDALTISMRKEIIWELIDRTLNSIFGRVIRNYGEKNLKRCNGVTFRTEIAVKSEVKYNN